MRRVTSSLAEAMNSRPGRPVGLILIHVETYMVAQKMMSLCSIAQVFKMSKTLKEKVTEK